MQLTMGGKSILRTGTFCTDLGQWYLAHDKEKVVSMHVLCLPV
jgi:hypothetical protein